MSTLIVLAWVALTAAAISTIVQWNPPIERWSAAGQFFQQRLESALSIEDSTKRLMESRT